MKIGTFIKFGVRNPKITLKSFSKQKKVLKLWKKKLFLEIPYIYPTAHIFYINFPVWPNQFFLRMKAIYLGVITAKNYFGHICAWYVINTVILFIILNHFCSNAHTRVLSYRVIENKLEFGVSGSIKTSRWYNFVAKSVVITWKHQILTKILQFA